MNHKAKAYWQLTKPRIVLMVLVTTVWGYLMARSGGLLSMLGERLFWMTMLGTGLGASGAAVLNQYLERDTDALMQRTHKRPLPAGLVSPPEALAFGLWLVLVGTGLLLWQVNLLTAFLVLSTNFLYVLVYTPMKRYSELNATFGSIPGALPPVIGCTAVSNELTLEGLALFAILFVWQHPHVYAIQWMCKEDFTRAGFKMLAVGDDGTRTKRHVILGTVLLIGVSLLPTLWGMAGWVYLVAALVMGVGLLLAGFRLTRSLDRESALGMMKATIIYLPMLLISFAVDALF
jgi:protoheme IX farnesyltransferase